MTTEPATTEPSHTEPAKAQGPAHEFVVQILENHLDTFGHVNNAKYLELFEQARWDWITIGGYGLARIMETRKGPIILDCALQFRREVTNRQTVTIRSWIDKLGPKVSTVRQEMVLKEASAAGAPTLCCAATFTMAFFDLNARRIIEPTADWLRALGLTAPQ
jgi:YbgC/YbaW family acyl-CoA thioester hydrolase